MSNNNSNNMTQSGNVCIVIPSNSAVSPRAIVIPRLSAHVPLSALATLGPTMDTWADNLGLTMALGLTITVGRADNTPRCPPCSYYWYIVNSKDILSFEKNLDKYWKDPPMITKPKMKYINDQYK